MDLFLVTKTLKAGFYSRDQIQCSAVIPTGTVIPFEMDKTSPSISPKQSNGGEGACAFLSGGNTSLTSYFVLIPSLLRDKNIVQLPIRHITSQSVPCCSDNYSNRIG